MCWLYERFAPYGWIMQDSMKIVDCDWLGESSIEGKGGAENREKERVNKHDRTRFIYIWYMVYGCWDEFSPCMPASSGFLGTHTMLVLALGQTPGHATRKRHHPLTCITMSRIRKSVLKFERVYLNFLKISFALIEGERKGLSAWQILHFIANSKRINIIAYKGRTSTRWCFNW